MTIRNCAAAVLALAIVVPAPRVFAQKGSRSTYTPPPPRPYTPPPSKPYTPPANSNSRSYRQAPQASNNNRVQPTPRVTVTPRNQQPGRTPSNPMRTPANNNNRAQQVANQNNRNRQIASNNLRQQQQKQLEQKQLQQKQLQQKQLFLQKQQQAKLSAQKQADAKARLAKLRASASNSNNPNSSNSTSVAHQVNPEGDIKWKSGGASGGGGNLQDQFNKAAAGDGSKAEPVKKKKTDKPVPEFKPKGPEFNPQ